MTTEQPKTEEQMEQFVKQLIFEFITTANSIIYDHRRKPKVHFSSFGSLDGLIENGVCILKKAIQKEQALIDKAVEENISFEQFCSWKINRGNMDVDVINHDNAFYHEYYICDLILPNYTFITVPEGDYYDDQVKKFINNYLDTQKLVKKEEEENIDDCSCCGGEAYGVIYVDKKSKYYSVCSMCYKFGYCKNRENLICINAQNFCPIYYKIGVINRCLD